jgi:thioredoxin reductase (NADPH)
MDSRCLTKGLDMSTIDPRDEHVFPKLTPQEIDRLRRFGEVRRYVPGDALFVTGDVAPGMYVLIKGSVRVTRRDPLGHAAPIVEQGPGEFVAEVGQLSGQPAFVDVHAIGDVEALLIPPQNLRALMIEEAELGERIMHALILRRVVVIEAGAGGPVLIGPESSPDVIRLQGFLARNAYPHQLLDPEKDEDAARLVQQYAPNFSDLPLAVCPKGTILKNPREAELARALGMVPIDDGTKPMTSRSSAPDPPASRRRSMRLPKVSRSSSSTRAPSADRQARARVSRIMSASRPAFPARRSPAAPMSRRKNSVPER